jgi:hypothetical protein
MAGKRSDLNAAGGVMTDEVGVITGEVTLVTDVSGTEATMTVQYKDAAEWYHVTGGKVKLHDAADADVLHDLTVSLLHRPE